MAHDKPNTRIRIDCPTEDCGDFIITPNYVAVIQYKLPNCIAMRSFRTHCVQCGFIILNGLSVENELKLLDAGCVVEKYEITEDKLNGPLDLPTTPEFSDYVSRAILELESTSIPQQELLG